MNMYPDKSKAAQLLRRDIDKARQWESRIQNTKRYGDGVERVAGRLLADLSELDNDLAAGRSTEKVASQWAVLKDKVERLEAIAANTWAQVQELLGEDYCPLLKISEQGGDDDEQN